MSLLLGFVFLSLLALLSLPIVVDRRTSEVRRALRDVVEPARSEITRLHVALATAGFLLSDYLNTGNPAILAGYRGAVAEEEATHDRLGALIGQLNAGLLGQHREVRSLSARWHADAERLIARAPVNGEEIAQQHDEYQELLVAVAGLDRSIAADAERHLDRNSATERFQRRVTFVLVPLALLAAFLVALLGQRLRSYAEEVERRRREVSRLMESKAWMIRGFSHDVRNPLGAALSYAELIADRIMGPINPRQEEALAGIRRSLRSAVQTTDDLVQLSRVEAGQLHLESQPTDLVEVLSEVLEEYRGETTAAGMTVSVALPSSLPVIESDEARVRQILGNLISNACKYAEGGSLTMTAEVRSGHPPGSKKEWLAVHVRDSGPGIAPENHESVFAEFSRVGAGQQPGAGLGLAISRRVARLLGGDLTVESELGRGANFILWLPLDAAGRRPARG